MRKPLAIAAVLLLAAGPAFAALQPAAQAPIPQGLHDEDSSVVGRYADDARLGRKCTRKVRRHYGSARGRHVKSLRLAFVQRCIRAGGRLD